MKFSKIFFIFLFVVGMQSVFASCDNCTDPWGPETDIILNNETISQKGRCTYTFIYKIRTRYCNGELQVDIVNTMITPNSSGWQCLLNQPGDCYYSRNAARRSLANFFNQPIVLSREAACYSSFEVQPPASFFACFKSQYPGETLTGPFYGYITCDAMSCCKIILTPLGGGPVKHEEVLSIPCDPNSTPNAPNFIIWECGGIQFQIPVVSPSGPCEETCNGNSQTIHKKETGIENIQDKDIFQIYPSNASDFVNFKIDETEKNSKVLIYSIDGKLMQTLILKELETKLDISKWANGIYNCALVSGKEVNQTKRFVVAK